MIKRLHPPHEKLQKRDPQSLRDIAYTTILELESKFGINASGKGGRFAAFFGRDAMITGLKLLRVYKKNPDAFFLRIIKNSLETAAKLQGKKINPLSGEETGKIIHEYRERGYYHLISSPNPWYTYPDNTLRNYDSIDSTPLFLILAAEYYNLLKDEVFLKQILPSIEEAFYWIKNYGCKEGVFLEYQLVRPEPYGGLVNQGWMDSRDSLLIYGKPPKESVALVEVQGYYYKALKLWSAIYEKKDQKKFRNYNYRANILKDAFNKLFLTKSQGYSYFSQAIFGSKAHILEIRSNPGHCLWTSVKTSGKYESIIDDKYIPDVAARLMKPDLFEPKAGIRTLSTKSKFFDSCSYHNGSIWPFDNGLIAEGLENFGSNKEAGKIKKAVLNAISQFGTPVELYCADKNGSIKEYIEEGGHYGSHKQAWTAATILDFTS